MSVFAVWTIGDGLGDAELQIIAHSDVQAKKEKKDLVTMDCGKVMITQHAHEGLVYRVENLTREGMSLNRAIKKVESQCNL